MRIDQPRPQTTVSLLKPARTFPRPAERNARSRHDESPTDFSPGRKGAHPDFSILKGGDVKVEEIVHWVAGRQEPLRLARRLEPPHLPFSSWRRLVRVLRPVIQSLMPTILDAGHQLAFRGTAVATTEPSRPGKSSLIWSLGSTNMTTSGALRPGRHYAERRV